MNQPVTSRIETTNVMFPIDRIQSFKDISKVPVLTSISEKNKSFFEHTPAEETSSPIEHDSIDDSNSNEDIKTSNDHNKDTTKIEIDPVLAKWLRDNDRKDSNFTHTTTYGLIEKWSLPNDNLEFWNKYCELVTNNPNGNYCLAEIPKKDSHLPVIAEFTLKFPKTDNVDNIYGYDFILAIVRCYQQAMLKTLVISETQTELLCCVLDSNDYLDQNLIINRFKLQFPYCKTSTTFQQRTLRPIVIEMLETEKVINRLSYKPINNWDIIIDPLTLEKPIMVYGSSESPNVSKLHLEYIFHKIEKENIDTKQIDLFEAISIFNNEYIYGKLDVSQQETEYYLPLFLSINYWKGVTLTLNKPPEKLVQPVKKSVKLNIIQQKYCKSCGSEQCTSYKERVLNGVILMSCDNSKEKGSEKIQFDSNLIETVGEKIISKNANKLSYYVTGTDKAIVDLILDNLYTILRNKKGTILFYNGILRLWRPFTSYQMMCVTKILIEYYINISQKHLEDNIKTAENKGFHDSIEIIIKQLKLLIVKLEKDVVCNRILGMLRNGLLSNFELPAGAPLAFPIQGGKVVNLTNGEIEDRNFSHYFTFEQDLKYLGTNYDCKNAIKFFSNFYQNEDDRLSLQERLGYCLTGDVESNGHSAGLTFLPGPGSGGKTQLINNMKAVLGDFGYPLMKEALLGTNKGGATPELMDIDEKRFCWISETEDGEKLKVARAKALTGGDAITARQLYASTTQLTVVAKFFILTNEIPTFDATDSIERRITICPFRTIFKHPSEYEKFKNEPNIALADKELCNNLLTIYLDEMFTYLVNGCIRYFKNGRTFTYSKTFNYELKNFLNNNDKFSMFINENCLVESRMKYMTEDEKKFIEEKKLENGFLQENKAELYDLYIKWLKSNSFDTCTRGLFQEQLKKIGVNYKHSNGHWYRGITLKPTLAQI